MEPTSNNETPNNSKPDSESKGFLLYARTRIFVGILGIVAVLWLINALINLVDGSSKKSTAISQANVQSYEEEEAKIKPDLSASPPTMPQPKHEDNPSADKDLEAKTHPSNRPSPAHLAEIEKQFLSELGLDAKAAKGVTFVTALVRPLDYELNERWWGWRPNDIINFTDNVNNFQVGVLEVTRRTTVILTDRISRTSSTDSLDKNLENAMNAFMISADRYWFPSAESKYDEGLDGLKAYAEDLKKGQARFYHRTDNLIPLLRSYEDLLGSCDENLVKFYEADGSKVSHFMADDYFYYAKGVSSALHTILQAVLVDYKEVLETRRATDDMHEAIESLHHAMEIDPIYVTNADLSGILANHRANIAATISHGLSYLQVVITALST